MTLFNRLKIAHNWQRKQFDMQPKKKKKEVKKQINKIKTPNHKEIKL
jgi:hypothetical protein